jgi:hypothetical protein
VTAASQHVASCYAPLVDGVPSRASIEIRRLRDGYLRYVVTVLRGQVAESTSWVRDERAALELAANLGYTEVVK